MLTGTASTIILIAQYNGLGDGSTTINTTAVFLESNLHNTVFVFISFLLHNFTVYL